MVLLLSLWRVLDLISRRLLPREVWSWDIQRLNSRRDYLNRSNHSLILSRTHISWLALDEAEHILKVSQHFLVRKDRMIRFSREIVLLLLCSYLLKYPHVLVGKLSGRALIKLLVAQIESLR